MKIIKISRKVYANAGVFEKIKQSFLRYLVERQVKDPLNNDFQKKYREVVNRFSDEEKKNFRDESGVSLSNVNNVIIDIVYKELYKDDYEKYDELAEDIAIDVMAEIEKMGVEYRFENIRGAQGIAKNDVCIMSNDILSKDPCNVMFCLFHELAHYYQYKKYGDDFALSVYVNDPEKIEEDVNKLMWIEQTANKFAVMKAQYYAKKYDIGCEVKNYGDIYDDKETIKLYLVQLKDMVKQMPKSQRNIKGINEFLYNMIKVK